MKHLPEIETQPPELIHKLQLERVKETVAYAGQKSGYYRSLFKSNNIPSNIQTWEDFHRIPTTSKDDLQKRNWEFLCVAKNQIAEYTSTSGTLGKPVTIALTKKDLERLAYNESISFACADGSDQDLYQLMLTLDRQFMAGIAYYEGIRKLGAGLVRVGPGLPSMQWETIDRLKPTTIVAVPSFILKLIEFAEHEKINPNESSVTKAICIGENIRDQNFQPNVIGSKINSAWNLKLFSTYASTEMQTAFTECAQGLGGHHHPELIYVELLDENGKPVDEGEVTITTLGVEAMPLIRYRTGDVARRHTGKCACGRTTFRLGPIVGRKQQMIKLKGTTIYPPGIFEILNHVESITDYVVEAYTTSFETDEIKIFVSSHDDIKAVERALQNTFQSRLRIIPEFTFVTAREIERMQTSSGRKVRKFIDRRSAP